MFAIAPCIEMQFDSLKRLEFTTMKQFDVELQSIITAAKKREIISGRSLTIIGLTIE